MLSEYLSGIPMFDEIDVVFDGKPGSSIGLFVPGWSGRYLKNRRLKLGFKELAYAEHNSLGWSLRLMAVPREQKYAIQLVLLEHGLKFIKAWLSTHRHDTWFFGHHVLQVGVNEEITELCCFETHNDRVIKDQIVSIQN